ncbi:hypothetical protein NHX12_030083 [Muraenolepis orangiensis]|uniref:Uncharacterized protein n=1 Tax=Muraenolepis orangiensis TaxID=630683 RepID=A0A9Q0E956_9TELE|nr:hypothetical protein NHX12_030083 [Muraenolepis orangiensis]
MLPHYTWVSARGETVLKTQGSVPYSMVESRFSTIQNGGVTVQIHTTISRCHKDSSGLAFENNCRSDRLHGPSPSLATSCDSDGLGDRLFLLFMGMMMAITST